MITEHGIMGIGSVEVSCDNWKECEAREKDGCEVIKALREVLIKTNCPTDLACRHSGYDIEVFLTPDDVRDAQEEMNE